MKTRQAFVSNSSSSSFIVGFAKVPESRDELRALLFTADVRGYKDPYDEASYSINAVTGKVWRDLRGLKEVSREEAVGLVEGGRFDGQPESPAWNPDPKDHRLAWKKWGQESKQAARQAVDRLLPAGLHLYEFEYSDQDGPMISAMEHGNLFERLHHIRVSHH